MFISIYLGPFARGPAEDLPLINLCLEQAVAAADAGFSMITFGEQHFNNYEPYCNPFMMGARLAPYLKQSYFGVSVCPIVFHHPIRLAENINVLDNLVHGRLIVGISAGRLDFSPDFENFDLDVSNRREIFEAKLDILLRAFAHKPGDPPLIYETPWDKGKMPGRLTPMSCRLPGPLLAVGTNTDDTVIKTAGRGWPVFLPHCRFDELQRRFNLYRDTLKQTGHAAELIENCLRHSLVTRDVIVGATDDEAWERAERMVGRNPLLMRGNDPRTLRELAQVDLDSAAGRNDPVRGAVEWVKSWVLAGSPDTVIKAIGAYNEAGIRQLLARFTVGPNNPQDMWRSFRLFVDEVLPHVGLEQFDPPAQIRFPEKKAFNV